MDGQLELLSQPQPEPVDVAAIAAQIGAVADAKEHGSVPTDTDERRASMAGLRDGEDLAAEQGARPPLSQEPRQFGPGLSAVSRAKATLDAATRRPTI